MKTFKGVRYTTNTQENTRTQGFPLEMDGGKILLKENKGMTSESWPYSRDGPTPKNMWTAQTGLHGFCHFTENMK